MAFINAIPYVCTPRSDAAAEIGRTSVECWEFRFRQQSLLLGSGEKIAHHRADVLKGAERAATF